MGMLEEQRAGAGGQTAAGLGRGARTTLHVPAGMASAAAVSARANEE